MVNQATNHQVKLKCIFVAIKNKKSMLDAYPNLRGMYDENDGNTQVLYLANATATFSSFTAAPEVIKF